jgi:hypothetical protein
MVRSVTKLSTTNECTSNVTHFDGHADVPVQCRLHRPMEGVQGFTQSHWTPPLGEYSHRIAPADNKVVCKEKAT